MGLLFELHEIFPAYFRWPHIIENLKLFQAQILSWCLVARFTNYVTVNLQLQTIIFWLCKLRYRIQVNVYAHTSARTLECQEGSTALPLTLQRVTARYAWKASVF